MSIAETPSTFTICPEGFARRQWELEGVEIIFIYFILGVCMAIKITGTKAVDCETIYDLPSDDINVTIEDTDAVRVKTILKVRDNRSKLEVKLLEYLRDDTPIETIHNFIDAIDRLNKKDENSIQLAITSSGISRFFKENLVGVVNFAASIATIISTLPS